jgi:hypothetical protein
VYLYCYHISSLYSLVFLRRSPATISLVYVYLHSKECALKHALSCIASVCALTQ